MNEHDPYCFASRGHYKCECTLIRMVIDRERSRILAAMAPVLRLTHEEATV